MTPASDAKRRFLEAVELDSSERQAYLAALRDGDERLHARVEQLLAAHERAEIATAEAVDGMLATVDAVDVTPPTRLANYELIDEIGTGGSGVVYSARQLDLGRIVALKLLRAGQFASESEVRRFQAEAEMAARLDHPAIVPIHEVGTDGGHHFISMKLIDGVSLDLCAQQYSDPRSAAALVAQVARAIDYGHHHGVLHRDIKPSNILVDADGSPYVADFGTAKLLGDRTAGEVTVGIIGTPSYMAPEQATQDGKVTVATDVYALGCLLYELLAGRPPFAADDLIETLRRVREEAPPLLRSGRPEIHRDLETICHHCLEKVPARRYDSALALAEDLERWLAFEPIEARPVATLERLWLAWRRKPVVSTLAAAVVLLAVLLIVGSIVTGFELRSGLQQTRAAESTAREQLRNAYLAEAHALRTEGKIGHRMRGLELVGLAAEIRPGGDLINEAVACLALTDLVTVAEWPRDSETESSVLFDPNLERYVICRLDGVVEVRSVDDGAVLFTLSGNGHPAWRSCFSPDGRYLTQTFATRDGQREPRFVVWDLERREIVYSVEARPALSAAFAPDRPVVAVAFGDGPLFERNLEDGSERSIAQIEKGDRISLVNYSPDGNRIALVMQDPGPVRILSLDGEVVGTFGESDQDFARMAWSADGSRVAAGTFDAKVCVWDVEPRALLHLFDRHQGGVVVLAFLGTDLLATSAWDGTSRLWHLTTGEQLLIAEAMLISASPDGRRLGFNTYDSVVVQELLHNDVFKQLGARGDPGVRALDVSPDGRFAATSCAGGFQIWELATGACVDSFAGADRDVEALLYHGDGELFVGSTAGLERWSIVDGKLDGAPIKVSPDRGKALASDASGDLVVGLTTREILVLGPEGEREVTIATPLNASRLTVSADGRWVAAGSWRGSGVHVWNTSDLSPAVHLCPSERYCVPQFSPDGRWLVYGTRRAYHFHAAGSWDLVRTVPRRGSNNSVATATRFSPDGALFAGLFRLREIGLLDSASGEEIAVLEPPGSPLPREICFTPDGTSLLVGTTAGHILVWDLARLEQKLLDLGLDPALGLVAQSADKEQ